MGLNSSVKTMKRAMAKAMSFSLAIMAGALLTACSSDDGEEVTPGSKTYDTYYLSVQATKGGNEAGAAAKGMPRRALSLEGNTLTATWATTEKVYVKYDGSWAGGTLSPNTAGTTVYLNGAISGVTFNPSDATSGAPALPKAFTLQFPRKEIDYTEQVGTLEDIAAKYDYATTQAHVVHIEGNNITAAAPVTFVNQQAIVRFTLQDQSGKALQASSLTISATGLKKNETEAGDITITPASPTDVIFAALSGVNGTISLTARVGSGTYVYTKSGVYFANGAYRHITVKMRPMSAPDATSLSDVTSDHIGHVVGANGKVYTNAAAATSANTTAVAMIAYVSEKGHGLAIALADEPGEYYSFKDAFTVASSKTPKVEGGTWQLPLKADWVNMASGCGAYTTINAKLESAGGTKLEYDYWAPASQYSYETIYFREDMGDDPFDPGNAYMSYKVRACLSF